MWQRQRTNPRPGDALARRGRATLRVRGERVRRGTVDTRSARKKGAGAFPRRACPGARDAPSQLPQTTNPRPCSTLARRRRAYVCVCGEQMGPAHECVTWKEAGAHLRALERSPRPNPALLSAQVDESETRQRAGAPQEERSARLRGVRLEPVHKRVARPAASRCTPPCARRAPAPLQSPSNSIM